MHKIHFRLGLRPGPRWGVYDAPRTPSRMVRGHLAPSFLPLDALGVSISRHTEWGGGDRAPLWLSTGLCGLCPTLALHWALPLENAGDLSDPRPAVLCPVPTDIT